MKRYMVIYSTPDRESVLEPGTVMEGSTWSAFFDDPDVVHQFKMDCECGLGGRCQVYQWNGGFYVFVEE